MHKKLSEMPKEWPLPRKGKKYIAVASHHPNKGFPLVFALRDFLKIAKTYREARKICLEGNVMVNGKVRKDVMFPLLLRDFLELAKIDKKYVLEIKNKKLNLLEVKDAKTKIVKVMNKRLLKNKTIQANLEDGTNILLKEKFSNGDSLLIELKTGKVLKVIPLKKGSNVEVISGKHLGQKGKIVELVKEGKIDVYEIKLNGEKNVFLKRNTLLAIE